MAILKLCAKLKRWCNCKNKPYPWSEWKHSIDQAVHRARPLNNGQQDTYLLSGEHVHTEHVSAGHPWRDLRQANRLSARKNEPLCAGTEFRDPRGLASRTVPCRSNIPVCNDTRSNGHNSTHWKNCHRLNFSVAPMGTTNSFHFSVKQRFSPRNSFSLKDVVFSGETWFSKVRAGWHGLVDI